MRVTQKGKSWFVWKKERLEATPERLAEMETFTTQEKTLLKPHL